MQRIQVNVPGNTFPVFVLPNETIWSIKQKIYSQESIPSGWQRLYLGKTEMVGGLLSDYNVHTDAIIISQNCFPQIEGFRAALKVSIPIHPTQIEKLPERMKNEQWFRPKVIFWNIGINHEASLAASIA
ncbi:hypothetical protein niasHT_007442 [Heterodera trifolii]|uniref:Ubiquitin-like domain-containing protein n=1 Tax=Heterodera trifolii TaxID=157864 RepID=A0ABD2LML7_9BILA